MVLIIPQNADARRPAAKGISPQYNPKYSAFLVDGDSGKILYQDGADELRHPASLTKMMTLYLLFEALENRKIKLDTELTMSEHAASRPPTNMSMQPGDKMLVRVAIRAMIIRSANDVATMVGEQLGDGDEEAFARIMTERAHQLGMKNTVFKNACGLHDPQQVTTAKDMALLAIALKKHYPQYFPYFAETSFEFNGVTYPGHNHVMEEYPGATGLKTGFIGPSGFNLVTTATRRGVSLVGVVLGGRTHQSRDANMIKLLDAGFARDDSLKSGNLIAAAQVAPDNDEGDEVKAANDNGSDEQEEGSQVASANLGQKFETNNYVRNLAAPVAAVKPAVKKTTSAAAKKRSRITAKPLTKSQRYKSNMIVVAPFSKPAPASKLFVPKAKATTKPDIGLGAAN